MEGSGEIYGAHIKNVDTTKPLGRLVENYANKKWWQGFWVGWGSAITGIGIGVLLDRYVFPKS